MTDMMCVFLLVSIICNFLRDQNHIFDIQYSVNESRATMGQDGSGPEFHVKFGLDRVGSLLLWVESRKLDPRPTLLGTRNIGLNFGTDPDPRKGAWSGRGHVTVF